MRSPARPSASCATAPETKAANLGDHLVQVHPHNRVGVDEAALAADDWRRTSADFTINLVSNLAVADALRTVAERNDQSTGRCRRVDLSVPGCHRGDRGRAQS
ncbi:MAG: hypothetical protein M3N95_14145 [Actinomycetota bacterium]|nr:hypothetical protein [Actinomycetota bacterium]